MGISFVSNIILARLLTPDDYGCVGMLMIFITVANTFIDGGFGSALIQKKQPTQEDYSTIFYHVLLHTETEDGNTDELKALVNGRIIQHFFDIFDAKEQQNRLDVIYRPKCKSAILPLALIYSAKYVYREYMAQNLNN